ncbi:MAG: polyprenyl synthetase family protein [archaeon]
MNPKSSDAFIEKSLPRKQTKEGIETLLGKPKFAYDVEAINSAINSPAWDLLDRGGKRWRPRLFSLIAGAFGKRDPCGLEALVEIVHSGTLIVDDVEDSSESRRGKPALHTIYGTDVAINLGNTLYYLPLKRVLAARIPGKMKLEILETYSIEMIRISHGQGLDIWWHRHGKIPTEKQYLQMCAYKTGTLARMAAEFAGIVAGLDRRKRKVLGEFTESLGVAFQIQDDLLNLVGDFGKYGKEIGGDITEGKKTLAVIFAVGKLGKEEASELEKIIAEHTKEPGKIERAVRLIRKSKAIEYCREKARELVKVSWAKAENVLPPSEEREELGRLARFLIERDF